MKLPPLQQKRKKTKIQKLFTSVEHAPGHLKSQVKEPTIKIEVSPEEVGVHANDPFDYLRDLPAVIEKVFQVGDHQGYLRFKSMQVELSNEKTTHQLILPIFQLNRIYKASPKEILDILSNSIFHDEGRFSLKMNLTHKINELQSDLKFPEKLNGNVHKVDTVKYNTSFV
jgi:hypothetical protein